MVGWDRYYTSVIANDTGGSITGYRLDLFNGTGQAVCSGYSNPIVIGACNSPTSTCPSSSPN